MSGKIILVKEMWENLSLVHGEYGKKWERIKDEIKERKLKVAMCEKEERKDEVYAVEKLEYIVKIFDDHDLVYEFHLNSVTSNNDSEYFEEFVEKLDKYFEGTKEIFL